MFHPDNIKNFSDKDSNVSNSLEKYWNTYGGPQELAKKLQTSLKVKLGSFNIHDSNYLWEYRSVLRQMKEM